MLKRGIWVAPVFVGSSLGFCEELSTSDKIRGNYENKIRFFAPPEKIFETFATLKTDDSVFMSYDDFFHSLTPFSFHKSDKEEKDYF